MNERSIVIGNQKVIPPEGLSIRNFLDTSVPRFQNKNRGGKTVSEVIVHETVTRSVEATVRVLQTRKLGVHFIIGPDGEITQHGDLVTDWLYHAGGHNRVSVGIEVVNPYYPKYLKPELHWKKIIEAPWADEGLYVVPTIEQAEANALLVEWLTSYRGEGFAIPKKWIALDKTRLKMRRVLSALLCKPGIYAHHYFGHADGAWLVLYAWLRFEAGLNPSEAYETAITRSTGTKRYVDLSDLIASGYPEGVV
jgi:hypothetical protein